MVWEFQPLLPDDIAVVLDDAQRYDEYAEAAAKRRPSYEEIMEIEPPAGILREKYIESLMYIHDLICDFSSTQVQSRFTPAEVEQGIRQVLDHPLLKEHPGVWNNTRDNYQAAQEIRKAAEQVQGIDNAFAVEQEATKFLDALLRTYRTIGMSRAKLTLQ
jgi:hypothetical protein